MSRSGTRLVIIILVNLNFLVTNTVQEGRLHSSRCCYLESSCSFERDGVGTSGDRGGESISGGPISFQGNCQLPQVVSPDVITLG